MLTTNEQLQIVKHAIAQFPKTFGLRAFPGKTFTIREGASYISNYPESDTIYLYTFLNDQAFCKLTPDELRAEIMPAPDSKKS